MNIKAKNIIRHIMLSIISFGKNIYNDIYIVFFFLCGTAPIFAFIMSNINLTPNMSNLITFIGVIVLIYYLSFWSVNKTSEEINKKLSSLMELSQIGILSVIIVLFIRSVLWRNPLWIIHY